MKGKKTQIVLALAVLLCVAALPMALTAKGKSKVYEVKITNLTRGSLFAPGFAATHARGLKLFVLGESASDGLEELAELGSPALLKSMIMPDVYDIVDIGAIPPGGMATVYLETHGKYDHISLASMLVPTNDAFFAVNGLPGPKGKRSIMVYSPAYDAGSEVNDEVCPSPVPPADAGGPCGPGLLADGEGYVHIHAGIHGIGSLAPADYDWRNPVARIEIRRVHYAVAP